MNPESDLQYESPLIPILKEEIREKMDVVVLYEGQYFAAKIADQRIASSSANLIYPFREGHEDEVFVTCEVLQGIVVWPTGYLAMPLSRVFRDDRRNYLIQPKERDENRGLHQFGIGTPVRKEIFRKVEQVRAYWLLRDYNTTKAGVAFANLRGPLRACIMHLLECEMRGEPLVLP